MVLGVVEEVRQRPVNPDRCATDAKVILGLWRALDRPLPDEFAADLRLVAAWAREAPDPLAARDIRAEGWAGGTDRHRDLATLCRQDRWSARLEAAQRWHSGGRPHAESTTPTASDGADPVLVAVEALVRTNGNPAACPSPELAGRVLGLWIELGGGPSAIAGMPADRIGFAVREWAGRIRPRVRPAAAAGVSHGR